jgi:peptide subunit release factor 1 (eRF1)
MATQLQRLVRRLAEITPLEEPEGEAGVLALTTSGATRHCAPVISVYLDMSLRDAGTRPEERPGTVVLRARLHEIVQSFWPRGVAYDAAQADAERIEQYVAGQASPRAHGLALFASAQHGLFETLEAPEPFANEVSVRAEPSLFQLARLLDDAETAVVAVVALNVARLFVLRTGQLIPSAHREDDPKLYHKIHATNAMNQKRFQHHADMMRADFARQVADMVEQLVRRAGAQHVIVAGELEAVARLRQALPPPITSIVSEHSPRLGAHAPVRAIFAAVEPLLREAEREEERGVVERLLEGVQAGELGVAGLEATRVALRAGQVDVLVLSAQAAFPPETRSALIELALRTSARVEVVEDDATLDHLGGVGALLRYRMAGLAAPEASPAPTA